MSWTKEEQAEHRAKWVEALRSGEYEQGRMSLRIRRGDKDAYCCLGVARSVAEGAGVPGAADDDNLTPNREVQNWLGLTDDCGITADEHDYVDRIDCNSSTAGSLTELNDHAGWTFAQIADLIESGGVKVQ